MFLSTKNPSTPFIVVGLAVMLIAFILASTVGNNGKSRTHIITNDLIYTKDFRTNLCFANSYPQSQWATMANVPCTPEVEKLIKE